MNDIVSLQVATSQSHIEIAEAARTQVYLRDEILNIPRNVIKDRCYIAHEFTINIQKGEMIRVEKIVALFTSKDYAISDCGTEAVKIVHRTDSFTKLLISHNLAWDNLWRRCDIAIQNSKHNTLALHLHIFHILQTISLNTVDMDAGIPARGLHGEAYRGHVFWDELFIFPFFNLRLPGITRELLLYRYRRLSEARWAAKKAGYEGAMYPWQSGSDGREESQTIHLNPRSGNWVSDSSHLQRHINAAIAYNVWNYYQVSGDIDFLSSYGAEMVIEIARFWASIARYNPSLDRYEIHKVMGPDEYHDRYPDAPEHGLNNNAYTNIMAVWVLCRALDVLEILPSDSHDILWDKLGLHKQELKKWDDISRKMHIVFHESGIISQFEGYDRLEEFDWEGYHRKYGNIHRLDRILEAEGDTTNRYKVSKQADVLMLFYLLSADELHELFERLGYPFEYETIPMNIDYYLKRTSHGSTLSRVVHSWVLARSKRELSWDLFTEALRTDISDIQGGTTSEGIHLGAMAGTVDLIQRCYTGLETREDTLWFSPCLPNDLKEVKFDIHYRGHWISLKITSKSLRFHTCSYDMAPVKVGFQDTIYELKPGDVADIPVVCTTE
jgi:alpha,alpha-trehalase